MTADDADSGYLFRALEFARLAAAEDEVPVGAVVVLDGAIIGEGRNSREKGMNPVGHAEICAISNAARSMGSWRLDGAVLYVTLEPCLMCLAACQQARIARVVYGAADAKGGAISLGYRFNEDGRLNHRFDAVLLESPECSVVLSDFFKKKRSKVL